jgi:hypothetical protein
MVKNRYFASFMRDHDGNPVPCVRDASYGKRSTSEDAVVSTHSTKDEAILEAGKLNVIEIYSTFKELVSSFDQKKMLPREQQVLDECIKIIKKIER